MIIGGNLRSATIRALGKAMQRNQLALTRSNGVMLMYNMRCACWASSRLLSNPDELDLRTCAVVSTR